mmetsp:Transcript_108651/g.249070  ORF Transcript_108651/g.249070 Transcript_108651/m.249070 type:complete len:177 (-) Transcript_108651:639-1169(-)
MAAAKLVDIAKLLGRGLSRAGIRDEQEKALESSAKNLFSAVTQLLSSCLEGHKLARNPALAYSLLRSCPPQLHDPSILADSGTDSQYTNHVCRVVGWLEEHCEVDDSCDYETCSKQIVNDARKAPADLGASLDSRKPEPFEYRESDATYDFFLPVVWRTAYHVMPPHVCWSPLKLS